MMRSLFYCYLILLAACSSREEALVKQATADRVASRSSPANAAVPRPSINLVSAFKAAQGQSAADNQQWVAEYRREYLETDDVATKCDLLVAIAELDRINTADFFVEALQAPEPEIRREAAIQLKGMVVHPDVREALIRALDERDDDVLIEVIEAVAGVRDPRILAKLQEIGASHPDQLIREVALDYANKIGSLD